MNSMSILQDRTQLHLARKVWHLGMGLFIIGLYQLTGMSRELAVTILGLALTASLAVEWLRLRHAGFNGLAIRLWRPLMRAGEENRLTGIPYFLASAILAVSLFPQPIVLLSLLFLACGDPIASFVGILYGKYGPRFKNGKTLIGTLAAVGICTALSALVWSNHHLTPIQYGVLVLVGGLAGGLAEALPLDMDDNFTIPIFSGFTLWVALIALGV